MHTNRLVIVNFNNTNVINLINLLNKIANIMFLHIPVGVNIKEKY